MANDNSSAWAAAGSAVGTAAANFVGGIAQSKRQFKFQKDAMALQQTLNKEMWDYQNAYNTPQAQMQRLQAAGLNPHLIYGSNANSGLAGPMDAPQAPSREAVRPDVPDAMFRYMQIRQMDAQYAATRQSIDLMRTRAGLTEMETALKNLNLMKEGIRSKNYAGLAAAELDTQKFIALRSAELFANERSKGGLLDQLHDIRKVQKSGMELENSFKQHRNDLAKLGIYSSDHPAFRMIIQAAERIGIPLDELLKKGAEKLMHYFK